MVSRVGREVASAAGVLTFVCNFFLGVGIAWVRWLGHVFTNDTRLVIYPEWG